MPSVAKSFAVADSQTSFPNGCEDVVAVDGAPVARLTLRPGWRWSNDVSPTGNLATCPVHHGGYCLSGQLHVEMNDGSSMEIGAGDLYVILPGHDAWVVGTEVCVLLDWLGKVKQAVPVAEPVGAAQ